MTVYAYVCPTDVFRKVAGLLLIYTYGTTISGPVGIIQDKKKKSMLFILSAVEI